MINLNKKYRTEDGIEVKLFEIIGHQVFGAYKHPINGWTPTIWNNDGTHDSLSGWGYNLVKVPVFEILDFEQYQLTKQVMFHGKSIVVPDFTAYVFVQEKGLVYASQYKPGRYYHGVSYWDFLQCGVYKRIGKIKYNGDPMDSLVEV